MTKWEQEINKLEIYFKDIDIPEKSIKINNYTIINNCKKLIETHISTLRANVNNKTFKAYFTRLNELKKYINNN